MSKTIWSSIADVRAAIVDGHASSYATQRTFDMREPTHVATLLALDGDELTRLVPPNAAGGTTNHRIVGVMSALAYQHCMAGDFDTAWRLYDAATQEPGHVDALLYTNALWSILDDNHHRGVMPERAAVYLARCLPHGPRRPDVFYNAACLCHELGDDEQAIRFVRDTVLHGYDKLDQVRQDPCFGELRRDPRFVATFDDPELLAERRERLMPPALVALKATEGSWDEMEFELYAIIEQATTTREWLSLWTGNSNPPDASLRIFGQDGTGGKVGFFRTSKDRPLEEEPVVFIGSEGELGVVARDLADFFVLFAANLGPVDIVALGSDDPPAIPPLAKVAELVSKYFPQARERTAREALAAREGAASGFTQMLRDASSTIT